MENPTAPREYDGGAPPLGGAVCSLHGLEPLLPVDHLVQHPDRSVAVLPPKRCVTRSPEALKVLPCVWYKS